VVLVTIGHLLDFLLDLSQLSLLVLDINVTLLNVLFEFTVGLNESVFEDDQLLYVERKHLCEIINLIGVGGDHSAVIPLVLSI